MPKKAKKLNEKTSSKKVAKKIECEDDIETTINKYAKSIDINSKEDFSRIENVVNSNDKIFRLSERLTKLSFDFNAIENKKFKDMYRNIENLSFDKTFIKKHLLFRKECENPDLEKNYEKFIDLNKELCAMLLDQHCDYITLEALSTVLLKDLDSSINTCLFYDAAGNKAITLAENTKLKKLLSAKDNEANKTKLESLKLSIVFAKREMEKISKTIVSLKRKVEEVKDIENASKNCSNKCFNLYRQITDINYKVIKAENRVDSNVLKTYQHDVLKSLKEFID